MYVLVFTMFAFVNNVYKINRVAHTLTGRKHDSSYMLIFHKLEENIE